jgi:hypothetical protein
MPITAEDLVRREVHYCVSFLVSTLAQGQGTIILNRLADNPLGDVVDQAVELCYGLDDYEEAAIQEGWTVENDMFVNHREETTAERASPLDACGWEDLCREYDIEPYQREVFEHWIVSDWLADRLAEKGEKVDKDFAGMTVWARTTTGQGIASDSVIEAIAADLNREG